MIKLILGVIFVVGSIVTWFLKEYCSRIAKKKRNAKKKFDKAIDNGNRIDVIDSFNDPD